MAYEELLSFIYSSSFMWIVIILILWEIVWKGIALWKTGRNNQLAWFVCVLIFNTIGILPIIYLAFFQKKKGETKQKKKK